VGVILAVIIPSLLSMTTLSQTEAYEKFSTGIYSNLQGCQSIYDGFEYIHLSLDPLVFFYLDE
jgi:hypothetical protein